MNERIDEFAEQAWIADCVEKYPKFKKTETTELLLKDMAGFHEKFAELIVRECMEVVDSTPLGYGDYRDQIEKGMRNASVNGLKQHFGLAVI